MSGPQTETIPIPGSAVPLVVERSPEGTLLAIRGGGRVHVEATGPDALRFGTLAQTQTLFMPGGTIRTVTTPAARWSERYGWDALGRLSHVDGVDVAYDAGSRVVSCRGAGGAWDYGYAGDHLAVIGTPRGVRHILRGEHGRPVGWREGHRRVAIGYDAADRRVGPAAPPANWRFDPLGRLLAVVGEDGTPQRTLLWDGWHCLGMLVGGADGELSEVFSLDPTGTPVRRISAAGCERWPRDAFGEALLGAAGVPGLFGGAIAGGLVHLPLRRLDPLTGSFDAPDPIDGEAGDPRRRGGYTGPLPVELPAAGPYTVCRNNPVTLADPTGGISDLWWLIPSALTWSLQNTIGSLLGMWLNLQFSPIGWIVSAAVGAKPFDAEWQGAKNFDGFALRADGWMSRIQGVPWTYQFLVSEEKESYTNLEDARLFAPAAAFRPALYGTVLRCAPDGRTPFLLRGQRAAPNGAALVNWSRSGGTAEPAFPGSQVPVFPAGGMHFADVQRGVKAGPATMSEIAPAGAVLTGAIGTFASVSLPGTGLGIAVGAAFALTDPAGVLTIGRALAVHEAVGRTSLRTDALLAGLATGPLTYDTLSPSAGTEPLTPVAGRDRLLDVAGSSFDYVPALSVVRLARGGTVLGAAGVTGLEARLLLDEAVPAPIGTGAIVRLASVSGAFDGQVGATPQELEIVTGGVPAVGDAIVVGGTLAAIVVSADAAVVTLDRAIGASGPAGTVVGWARLAPGAEIGRLTGAADPGAELAYTPSTPGLAPNVGFVLVQGTVAAARRVTGRGHDAIVLSEPLPAAGAAPFDAERFRRVVPTIAGATATDAQTFALSTPIPAGTGALQLLAVPGPAPVPGGQLVAGANVAAGTASQSHAPGAVTAGLRPSELVALVPAGGGPAVPAQIRRLTLTITLDRALAAVTGPVEAALLAVQEPGYTAEQVDARVVRVRPMVGTARLDFPRFRVGELAELRFTGGTRLIRIVAVTGETITFGDDAAALAPATAGITIRRLVAADPGTGGARIGINGTLGGTALTLDVWQPEAFGANILLAIISAGTAFAVRVGNAAQPLAIALDGAGGLAGAFDILALTGTAGFTTRFTTDGATLDITDPALALAGMQSAVVVPWIDGPATVAGVMHPGSVRVPAEHENAALQNTRKEALTDHELTHTLQSAKWGPLLLTGFPMWALELATDLSAAGGPAFTPYGPGTLAEGVLTASDATLLEPAGKLQVAQGGHQVLIDLGPAAPGGGVLLPDAARRQLSAAGMIAGAVQLRRPLGGAGSSTLEWMTNVGQLLTVGGLLNNITLASWGGLAALIHLAVSAIRRATRSRITATLQPGGQTLVMSGAEPLEGLTAGMLVALKAGDRIVVRPVDTIIGQTVTLGTPAPAWGGAAATEVELSIYSPGSALFGLRDYHRAELPDPDAPARMRFVGDGPPELAVHDRIELRAASGASLRTLVTAVTADTFEVADPLLQDSGAANEFLIGRIAAQDPTGWLDSWLLDELNIGWMQYIYDPWGKIIARNMPDRSSIGGQVFARSARYLFGTQSWAALAPPICGYFWIDNALNRDHAHRSQMEQEASWKSGDTYSPIGTLHGEIAVVGDIARYWVTVTGGSRDGAGDFVRTDRQDQPGVAIGQFFDLPDGAANARVPAAFADRDAGGLFTGVAARGFVPVDQTLERSAGIYVAFTRPATTANYRIISIVGGDANAIDAQEHEQSVFFHDRAPADVTVTLAGVPLAEGATLSLIPFQRAVLAVAPAGARVYRATVAGEGALLQANGLTLTALGQTGTDDAEISRYYRYDPAAGRFESALGPVHLPDDIDVAVRRFAVAVVATLPLRATADHTAAAVTSARPGETLFLLVPAPIDPVPPVTAFSTTPPLAPAFAAEPVPAGSGLEAFLGDGGAIRVTLPPDQPPEAVGTLTVTLRVGTGAAAVPVTASVDVAPHFTLDSAGGAPAEVAPGATLVLQASDGTTLAAAPAGLPAGVAAIALTAGEATVTIAPGAAPGPRTILLADAADAGRMARRIITVTP